MGNGTVDKGLPSIRIKFRRDRPELPDYVVEQLEGRLGRAFDNTVSRFNFKERVRVVVTEEILIKHDEAEVVFTPRPRYSWANALADPYSSLLVRSKRQVALDEQYAAEDAQAAIVKQQRLTDYDARLKDQQAEDELKFILRDGAGNKILDIYDSQQRASNYADKLDNSFFNLYAKSGFNEKYLTNLVCDYFRLLNSQLTDLQQFNEFLMTQSATYLGRSVTFTGGIERPDLKGSLTVYNNLLRKSIETFNAGGSAQKALNDLGGIERYCKYASGVLKRFYEESVSQSQRIAFAVQIAQMVIPIGASAKGLQILCLAASQKFSYEITKKVVYGSDTSWAKTLLDASLSSTYDTILRFGVRSLVSKIPVINEIREIKGDVVRIAVKTVTTNIAKSIGAAFKGGSFGEALSNLLDHLTNYQTWVSTLATQTSNRYFGKYLDVPTTNVPNPAGNNLPESVDDKLPGVKQSKERPVEKEKAPGSKKTAGLLQIVPMFGVARSANGGVEPPPANRPAYLNRGTEDKGIFT